MDIISQAFAAHAEITKARMAAEHSPFEDPKALERRMHAYARLIVEAGCALHPGQELFVRANLEAAPLVRLIVK
ncbi:MAG TPA: aminopeptidase, partial [Slackia equolifaciens]|nr:aminopeptidase [Slackia equolifaciens]